MSRRSLAPDAQQVSVTSCADARVWVTVNARLVGPHAPHLTRATLVGELGGAGTGGAVRLCTHIHTPFAHTTHVPPPPAPTRSHRPPPYTQTVVCTHSAPDLSSGGHSKHSDVFTVNTVTSVYLPDAVVGRAFRETDTGEVLLAGRAMLVAWKRASCRRSLRCGRLHLPEYTVHAAV